MKKKGAVIARFIVASSVVILNSSSRPHAYAQLINQQVQQIATGGLYNASNIAALAKVPAPSGVGVGVVSGTEPGAAATSLGSLSFAPTSQTVATPGLLSATVGLQTQGQGTAVGGMLDYGRWNHITHIHFDTLINKGRSPLHALAL